jgi:catechol 2,3-dioxygenase-like lactoylglutathione lyase family enzyme
VVQRIEAFVSLFEQKRINRRQLVSALVATVASAGAAPAEGAPSLFDGRIVNHVTMFVTDLQKSREFYERLVGATVMYDGGRVLDMRLSGGTSFVSIVQSNTPRIDHLCIGIPNFDTDRAETAIKKEFPDSKAAATSTPLGAATPIKWRSVNLRDPDGNSVQLGDVKFQLDGKH